MSGPRPWVVIPGIWNSDPDHWQSVWERDRQHDERERHDERDQQTRRAVRIAPDSWSAPVADDWRAAISTAVAACSEPPVLVAHSLGVLAAADWLATTTTAPALVAGAFLVAPPDPLGDAFPAEASGFAPPRPVPPEQQVPTHLVVSDDDPYCGVSRALEFAAAMRADVVRVGALGHVNVASGVGGWPAGRELLRTFEDGLRRTR
ncbi:RBBP9/YdeN family alpha/beta hydrolase [Curtobacterium poinsettiae]|uniref:RBBP9/YdeN family alpha/beta hydrolase n=1 Tax=Curtobacterium poinsettiae TaxID=159612 RepID=UPI0021C718D7|nr:alpha/beta hydrolase [Curtobacterium flaccumfaciens]MCU0114573.1 alpha/beta hydrolase [Curtobacterium flaccumfaciens]MCU0154268.1 alpha/beta hydrolase [Curtobacterium flaccumfaciens pv. poinsettiae]UXN13838.1 alpha/beta hydrolase [Curtobacterium flaccumfaciens pv. poinsettiae]